MTGALLSSDETHNTLKFANRAKRMKNHAAINEVSNEKVGWGGVKWGGGPGREEGALGFRGREDPAVAVGFVAPVLIPPLVCDSCGSASACKESGEMEESRQERKNGEDFAQLVLRACVRKKRATAGYFCVASSPYKTLIVNPQHCHTCREIWRSVSVAI